MQDKTLTGTWKSSNLFFIVFFVTLVYIMIKNNVREIEQKPKETLFSAMQVSVIAVVLNYIAGNLFKSRKKMYKSQGFSSQRSTAQAYSNARLGQVLGAMV
jgi:uncharacterized membrane protein SirB2